MRQYPISLSYLVRGSAVVPRNDQLGSGFGRGTRVILVVRIIGNELDMWRKYVVGPNTRPIALAQALYQTADSQIYCMSGGISSDDCGSRRVSYCKLLK